MNFQPYFLFLAVWTRLARKGACDEAGGAEFRRVFAEWTAAGLPLPVAHFIRRRSNISCGGKPPKLFDGLHMVLRGKIGERFDQHELN